MKILSIGNFGHGWDGSICDEEHIASTLEELGHEVIRLPRENAGSCYKYQDVDFTLISQWDGYQFMIVPPGKVVYWAFDYQADGQEWHERLIAMADLYLSKRITDSKHPNWQWLSQDFAPSFLDKYPLPIEKDIDVLFTGSYLDWATDRVRLMKLLDEKFNLVVHSITPGQWKSAGLKNAYGPVMDEQLPELIARAKINIAIDHTLESGYWSDRASQIMACGGFVLQRYVPLMETVFRQKIGYFYSDEDCVEKIRAFLDMPDEDRETMAEIGYDYAHQELMAINRVSDLLTIVDSIL